MALSVSEGAWLNCSHCTLNNSIYAISAAKVSVGLESATSLIPIDVANVVVPTGPNWTYESVLTAGNVSIVGSFAGSGAGFEEASAIDAATTMVSLRLPTAIGSVLGLAKGCIVQLLGTPVWRNGSDAELSIWRTDDVSVVSCPVVP